MIQNIGIVDMHTGGEPVRIITDGYPPIFGHNILQKRRYALENLDYLRRFLMHEPRGHYDMYGIIPVEPDIPTADIGVLFMHNEGYSTMCGHAIIAIGRFAVDQKWVTVIEPKTKVVIQCPCGLVTAQIDYKNGKSGAVHFESVPAFVFARNKTVNTQEHGPVTLDISYGGAFYAIVNADQFGLNVRESKTRDLIDAASIITKAVKTQVPLLHPDNDDLAFLYGTILTDGNDEFTPDPTANICVFANNQVDRSPTGSGVTARIALQYRRGLISLNQTRSFVSITGAEFRAKALNEVRCGNFHAVTVEVSGMAYYTGRSVFSLEAEDEIGKGFLLT